MEDKNQKHEWLIKLRVTRKFRKIFDHYCMKGLHQRAPLVKSLMTKWIKEQIAKEKSESNKLN